MDRRRYLDAVETNSAQLLRALRDAPSAPAWEGTGWDRTQLVEHVARVYAWMGAQIDAGPVARVRFSEVPPPEGGTLAETFERVTADLVDRLAAMDTAIEWTTWAGPQPGTFYPRRMAHESAIHRWDTVGGPVEADLAVDGVTELLEIFAPRVPPERFTGPSGSVHLHATDIDGEWLVRLGPERVSFELGHAKGDAALRGGASDLLLWAWNRVPLDDRFEVFGDAARLEAWRNVVVF
jgi:uncharacterized protein (TIGR03083 family)